MINSREKFVLLERAWPKFLAKVSKEGEEEERGEKKEQSSRAKGKPCFYGRIPLEPRMTGREIFTSLFSGEEGRGDENTLSTRDVTRET